MTKKLALNVIDLFCGCGGISEGFREAGYNILLGIDDDESSLKTFENRFGKNTTLKSDLFNNGRVDKIKDKTSNKNIHIIIGGLPCQGFSLTGTRVFEDPRNKLYLSFYEIVKKLKPLAFVMENVPGMAKLYDGSVKNDIYEKFSEIGYKVKFKILNAADFGVPQIRKRLIIVGLLEGIGEFKFPEPLLKEKDYVTCEEAIGDLPALDKEFLGEEISEYDDEALTDYQKEMRKNSEKLSNHIATKHTDYVKVVIAQVPEGKNHKFLPKGVGESRKFNEAWTRYHSKKPSKTIDTGHRNHFHYKYNRVPTVRENARLQSFPDDFIILGPKTQQYKQVGNAVPPKLAYYIAKRLKEVIENEN